MAEKQADTSAVVAGGGATSRGTGTTTAAGAEVAAAAEAARRRSATRSARREATAAQKRMEPIMKNAVRDKEGAERREQDLIEEKDRLMGMLEKERIQIGSIKPRSGGNESGDA